MKSSLSILALLLAAVAAEKSTIQGLYRRDNATCKCLPGESCWPEESRWTGLRQAVQGRLFSVVPAGAVCYPSFGNETTADAAKCAVAKANWTNPDWMRQVQGFSDFWANNSCEADDKCKTGCTAGLAPSMVVMAKNQFDVQVSVNFARINNIRLVIRNTGRDYLGRSTGYGALALNTHGLQTVQFMKTYTGPGNWSGSAVKVGAGVMLRDLYPQAAAQGVDIVGGECPTLGIAGGYIQGGGYSPLSGIHGLASDNALEFAVILANGQQVTANAENNPDLFWALKGGGVSTFAAVYSVTLKTHPIVPAVGVSFNMSMSQPNFWKGVQTFYGSANDFVDAGLYVRYLISPTKGLSVQPFVAPNMTTEQFNKVLQPFLGRLKTLNVTYALDTPKAFPSFFDLYKSLFVPTTDAISTGLLGGRVFSKDDVAKNDGAIVDAVRAIVEAGHPYSGNLVNPGRAVPDPTGSISSVHPVWRKNAGSSVFMYTPDTCQPLGGRDKIFNSATRGLAEALRKASPTSGVNINEGDIDEPNWQDAFWGSNYKKLSDIKAKYDPDGVFWAKSTPGSEKWTLQAQRKLCKTV